jgi:dihydropteroate synthase
MKHARGELALDHCLVMGIVNRTPDSFYDGGRMGLEESVEFAIDLVEQGAEVLDLGGVKAGPGAEVPVSEEMRRVVPAVEALSAAIDVPLSIETARPQVASAVIDAGAAIINDVSALADEALADVCAETGAGLVLMHNGGQLRGRPRHPRYGDVVVSVVEEWDRQAGIARAHGVTDEQLMFDPGLDFGKTAYHSLELMRRIDEMVAYPGPVLIAPSRKDIVGEALALPLEERLEGTLALVALTAAAGAAMVRVHDVRAASRTVAMVEAVLGMRPPLAPVRGLWD